MTDRSSPPQLAQHLLGALGAHADTRDAILGDLHELFVARATRDGASAARRWYWREALRSAPHLMVRGMRGQALHAIKRTATAIAFAYLSMLVLGTVVSGALRGLLWATGFATAAVVAPRQISWVALALMLATGALQGIIGGALAAYFDRHAPLRTSLAMATLWSVSLAIGYALFMAGGLAMWFIVSAPVVAFLGTTTGGLLYVRHSQGTAAA